jgi:DNA topoisomerase-1
MVILVIIESNAKNKKIDNILCDNYKTVASFGHVIDLDPKKMSIDFKTFEPKKKLKI